MTKTARLLVIGGAVAVAAVVAYQLIPALKNLAENLRTLQLMVDAEDPDAEPEDYQVGDLEAIQRINEAAEKHGWVTHE